MLQFLSCSVSCSPEQITTGGSRQYDGLNAGEGPHWERNGDLASRVHRCGTIITIGRLDRESCGKLPVDSTDVG